MLSISQKVITLTTILSFYTKKSRSTTTPKPFNNPQLTPLGILTKKQKSYNYHLPQNLPNRHLYWNRTVQNRISRNIYNKCKLERMMINPIHQNGVRVMKRSSGDIIAELTSLNIIKGSVGRTLANIHESIIKYPQLFLLQGPQANSLNFAIKQVHDRYLPTLNFYKFSTYCQLRHMAKLPPTQSILLHFFRHLQAQKVNKTKKIPLKRLGQLTRYIFSIQYPECNNILYKKPFKFSLFQSQQKYITFQDIVPNLYDQERLKQIKLQLKDKDSSKSLKAIQKMPGGKILVQKITNA